MNDTCAGFHIHQGKGKSTDEWTCDKCGAVIRKHSSIYIEKLQMLDDIKGLNEDLFGRGLNER